MNNRYHALYPNNPTLRQARLTDEALPKAVLRRQHDILARPFAGHHSMNPTPVKDLIQKRRRGERTSNYLESVPWQFGGLMKQTPF